MLSSKAGDKDDLFGEQLKRETVSNGSERMDNGMNNGMDNNGGYPGAGPPLIHHNLEMIQERPWSDVSVSSFFLYQPCGREPFSLNSTSFSLLLLLLRTFKSTSLLTIPLLFSFSLQIATGRG